MFVSPVSDADASSAEADQGKPCRAEPAGRKLRWRSAVLTEQAEPPAPPLLIGFILRLLFQQLAKAKIRSKPRSSHRHGHALASSPAGAERFMRPAAQSSMMLRTRLLRVRRSCSAAASISASTSGSIRVEICALAFMRLVSVCAQWIQAQQKCSTHSVDFQPRRSAYAAQIRSDELRALGTVRTYEDLHAILRQRAEALDVSRLTIDEIAGVQSGYTSKILAPQPTKRLGPISFPALLGALGLKLVVVEDKDQLRKIARRLTPRGPGGRRANLAPANAATSTRLLAGRLSTWGRADSNKAKEATAAARSRHLAGRIK
jgi:hypothetical protein